MNTELFKKAYKEGMKNKTDLSLQDGEKAGKKIVVNFYDFLDYALNEEVYTDLDNIIAGLIKEDPESAAYSLSITVEIKFDITTELVIGDFYLSIPGTINSYCLNRGRHFTDKAYLSGSEILKYENTIRKNINEQSIKHKLHMALNMYGLMIVDTRLINDAEDAQFNANSLLYELEVKFINPVHSN